VRLFRKQRKEPEILAAVDLGSNSFHMLVARFSHGQPKVLDRIREMVRLAEGLGANGQLSKGRRQLALECLSRFGERLRDLSADSVRVVGTNTLRKVGQNSDFVAEASERIGHSIEIISGIEEARLVYQGVVHTSPAIEGPQLVIDIGGGSTEIIRGQGFEPEALDSLKIGCVGISERAFESGKLSKSRFKKARLDVRLKLEPVRSQYSGIELEGVSGASGTIRAAASVLSELAGEPTPITVEGLQTLIDLLIDMEHIDNISLPGLSDQRAPVFAGGIAILIEVMSRLGLEQMTVADGALREGIIYDMVGRLTNEDARDRAVRSMEKRFNIDEKQADRVEATALVLFEQVAEQWGLDQVSWEQLLAWAARLHEVGLHIAHTRYNRHGAYLIENADMPGFPTEEQRVLARLVGEHRGRFGRVEVGEIPEAWETPVQRLTVLLRLAALFNRGRTESTLPELKCRGDNGKFSLLMAPEQKELNPLTWADLEREKKYLAETGLKMKLVEELGD